MTEPIRIDGTLGKAWLVTWAHADVIRGRRPAVLVDHARHGGGLQAAAAGPGRLAA